MDYVVMVYFNGGWCYLNRNGNPVDDRNKAKTWKTEEGAQKKRASCGFYQTMISEK